MFFVSGLPCPASLPWLSSALLSSPLLSALHYTPSDTHTQYTHFYTMKYSSATAVLAAASATVALAQNSTSGNGTDAYTTGLVSALNSLNLTTLTTVLGVRCIASRERAIDRSLAVLLTLPFPPQAFPQIGQTLSQGGNYTVFAPSNEALAPLLAQGASALSTAEVGRNLRNL